MIVDGIEEAVSELFAGLGLIYQKMEKERSMNETCLRERSHVRAHHWIGSSLMCTVLSQGGRPWVKVDGPRKLKVNGYVLN